MKFIPILLLLVQSAFCVEFQCLYIQAGLKYFCNLEYSSLIKFTTANEPITVSENHLDSKTNDDVGETQIHPPHIIRFVPTMIFDTFKNLKHFEMSGVQLNEMTTNAITNCMKLETIDINSNNFPTLPASFAESCVKLSTLNLFDNHISFIHKDAFKGLGALEALSLEQNTFESLDPSTFYHTPNMKRLYLNNGKLKALDSKMFADLSLTELAADHNQIKSIPALKFMLAYFPFSDNGVTEIDPEFLKTYPGDLVIFDFSMHGNICANGHYTSKEELSLELQPCFDNWAKSHPATTSTDSTTTIAPSNPQPCLTCSSHKLCRFYLDHDELYSCVIEGVDFSLLTIGGDHQRIEGQTFTDADVKAVYVKHSILSRVPSVIFTKFPNVEFLSIPSTQMTHATFSSGWTSAVIPSRKYQNIAAEVPEAGDNQPQRKSNRRLRHGSLQA
jgi:Leucine-rich repeat (LRR) protein